MEARSSAGGAERAVVSAASTTLGSESAVTPCSVTTPADPPMTAITVSCLLLETPLVVSELLAQRRLASVTASAITTHSSAVDRSRARSTRCCEVGKGSLIAPPPAGH